MTAKLDIRPVADSDQGAILELHQMAFGPGRFSRTAYRVREATRQASEAGRSCSFTGWYGEQLVASVTMTPIAIGGRGGAMLLGPLAVAPAHVRKGLGQPMVARALEAARQQGCALVILVGDTEYYGRFGFHVVPAGQILLPGPVNPNRILAHELSENALAGFTGSVAAASESLSD